MTLPMSLRRVIALAALALLGGLAEKLAGFEIEETFVSGGAIAANEAPAGGEGVADGDIAEFAVVGFAGGVEDDAHVIMMSMKMESSLTKERRY